MRHHSPRSGLFRRWLTATTALAGVLPVLALTAPAARANPEGGSVVQGAATITQTNPKTVTVNQTTDKAVINWRSFSIGAGETTRFNQPSSSSTTLNRVTGDQVSQILGTLSANGKVFLVNPNGIVFGAGSKIDVAALVASTADIKNENFMAGNLRFDIPGKVGAAIINQGSITAADGGLVALVSPVLRNSGIIQARLGKVALASANGVTLDLYGDNLILFQASDKITQQMVDTDGKPVITSIDNDGQIYADGGRVLMTANTAKGLVDNAINTTGLISARAVEQQGGEIVLKGEDGGNVQVGGTLDASAPASGDGGFIETSGEKVTISPMARITTNAPVGKTGRWLIDPTDYVIAASGGDITSAQLATYLNTTDIEIQTATEGIENGDIYVNQGISWTSANKLTLTAYRHIYVNELINAVGGGSIKLRADNTGTGIGTVAFAGGGHIIANNGAAVGIYYNPTSYSDQATQSDAGKNPYSTAVTRNGNSTLNAYMLVNDINKLQSINQNLFGHYALGKNIDASDTANWNSGSGFIPIGTPEGGGMMGGGWYPGFLGQLDGDEHTISNLTINNQNLYSGLFSVIGRGSKISNLSIVNGSVSGYVVGGIVGVATDGSEITNVHYSGTVHGYSNVGGVAGVAERQAPISRASSSGTVTGDWSLVGGLVGNAQGPVCDSFSTANVTGVYDAGGAVGMAQLLAQIKNVYSTGSVNGTYYSGALIGQSRDSAVTSNSYWNSGTSVLQTSGGGAGVSASSLMHKSTFIGWNFDDIWKIEEGVSFPTLRKSASTQSIGLTPGVTLSQSTIAMFNQYRDADASTLLNGILKGDLRNDPTNAVWHALYQNGRATPVQVEANRLWNVYDDYRSADANTLATALMSGVFTSRATDPIWRALAGNPNLQAALDIVAANQTPTQPIPQQPPGPVPPTTPPTSPGYQLPSINFDLVAQVQQAATPTGALLAINSAFGSFANDAAMTVIGGPINMAEHENSIANIIVDYFGKSGEIKYKSNTITSMVDSTISLVPSLSFAQNLQFVSEISSSIDNAFSVLGVAGNAKELLVDLPKNVTTIINDINKFSKDINKIKLLSNLLANTAQNTSDQDRIASKIELFSMLKDMATTTAAVDAIASIIDAAKTSRQIGKNLAEFESGFDKALVLIVGSYQTQSLRDVLLSPNQNRILVQEYVLKSAAKREGKTVQQFAREHPDMTVYALPENSILPDWMTKPETTTLGALYGG